MRTMVQHFYVRQRKVQRYINIVRVPIRVSYVAIGESSKELAKQNLWILAILAKSILHFFPWINSSI